MLEGSRRREAGPHGSDASDARFETIAGIYGDHRTQRAGEYEVAGPQGLAERCELPRQPDGRVERVTETGVSASCRYLLALALHHHLRKLEVQAIQPRRNAPQHDEAAGGVIGHGVDETDVQTIHCGYRCQCLLL